LTKERFIRGWTVLWAPTKPREWKRTSPSVGSCAAAVAEARGFIAASSRILTALDHLPRGVVPAAPPVKWHNRAVWRAAAAVLVVAVGSLVVVRNSEHKAGVPKVQPTTPITTSPSVVSPRATFSGKPTGGTAQPNAVGRERALRNEAAATGGYAAAPSQIVGALAATPQPAAPSRVAEVTTMDVASEQLPLQSDRYAEKNRRECHVVRGSAG